MPNSQVDIFIYSDPTWLGSVITDEQGNYSVTLPFPKSLSIGIHTFQAQGVTKDGRERQANVPVELIAASKQILNSRERNIYFDLNSYFLDSQDRKVLKKLYSGLQNKLVKATQITIHITGWVQPTRISPNEMWLSKNRAKVVAEYLKQLGLKGRYVIKTPGHDRLNNAKSRRTSIKVSWYDTE